MKTFYFIRSYTVIEKVEIEANTEEEARELLKDEPAGEQDFSDHSTKLVKVK